MIVERIATIERALSRPMWRRLGAVRETVGPVLRVSGLRVPVGELCAIRRADGSEALAEAIAFRSDHVALVPFDDVRGVEPGADVRALGHGHRVAVGDFLVGRVLDGFGRPVDDRPVPSDAPRIPVERAAPNPLDRPVIREVIPVGVRAIDALNTLGVGQRIGLFSVAGGGKTTLLKMIAHHAQCDVAVMCIVGERGRELNEFLSEMQGAQADAHLVCVATTSDRPAFERARAAFTASAIAEHFRDRGARVLLLVDSVTRFARAQRELGVSIGEPVTRRGYTVSVFSELARLMERAGPATTGSSPLMPAATSPSAMPFTSSGWSLQKSAIWSNDRPVLSMSQTAVAFGIRIWSDMSCSRYDGARPFDRALMTAI